MDFEFQCAFGGCFYQGADAGELLSTAARVKDGDFESWYQEWVTTAKRLEGLAQKSAETGNRVSASQAFLRAANYYALANIFIDGTKKPERQLPTYKKHRACWDQFTTQLNPAAEKIEIPYEDTPMPAFFFKPPTGRPPYQTIIFNNGSDGPISGMWANGTALALEHNGDVYSCDHYVDPAYKLGNIKSTPLAELVASPAQLKFGQDKRATLPKQCRDCQVEFACHGGCPKNRFAKTAAGEPGLNYLCAGYKSFFTHIDQPMRRMAELLRAGQAPAEIMTEATNRQTPS